MAVGTSRPGRKAGARPTLPPGGRDGDALQDSRAIQTFEINRLPQAFQCAHPGSGAALRTGVPH